MGYQENRYKKFKPLNPATKERKPPTSLNKNIAQREPLKCWECDEPHYFKDCPIEKKFFNNVHSIQEATKVGDMERSMQRISATLEIRQEDHQIPMVKIEV